MSATITPNMGIQEGESSEPQVTKLTSQDQQLKKRSPSTSPNTLRSTRKPKLHLSATASQDDPEIKAKQEARERTREKQREEQRQSVEAQLEQTRLQMHELAHQLAVSQQLQQDAIKALTPGKVKRRGTEDTQSSSEGASESETLTEDEDGSSTSSEDDDIHSSSSSEEAEDILSLDSSASSHSDGQEEKKETDRRHKRGRQPKQPISNPANALNPVGQVSGNLNESTSSIDKWREGSAARKRGSRKSPSPPPRDRQRTSLSPPPRKPEDAMTVLKEIASSSHSETSELDFFDWNQHRKDKKQRRHSAGMEKQSTPKTKVPMGSKSDPDHTQASVRRRYDPDDDEIIPEDKSFHFDRDYSERKSKTGSLQESSSQQEGMDMVKSESESVNELDETMHQSKTEEEFSPLQHVSDQHDSAGKARTLDKPSPPPPPPRSVTHPRTIDKPPAPPPPPRSVTNPRPKQPIFVPPPPPPQQRQPRNLLDDVAMYHDDDFLDHEENEAMRRHQQNVLHLSSSWNDLFTSSASQVTGQQQMTIPKRRGSLGSSGGASTDDILVFEPDEEAIKAQNQESVKELENEARPSSDAHMSAPPEELLHLSGSITGEFFQDDDKDDDFDKKYNESIESWKSSSNLRSNSFLNTSKSLQESLSQLDKEAGIELNVPQYPLSVHSGSDIVDYFSHSSDDPSKILNRLSKETMSQYTEVTGVNATTLMEHLKKHGKPPFRWDAKITDPNAESNMSSHHGQTTVTTEASGIGDKPANPVKENRRSQRDKKKRKEDSHGGRKGPTSHQDPRRHHKKSQPADKEEARERHRHHKKPQPGDKEEVRERHHHVKESQSADNEEAREKQHHHHRKFQSVGKEHARDKQPHHRKSQSLDNEEQQDKHPHHRKPQSLDKEDLQDMPPRSHSGRRAHRPSQNSLSHHLEMSHSTMPLPEEPTLTSDAAAGKLIPADTIRDELDLSAHQTPEAQRSRRLPSRERRPPGRTRSRSLTDLRELKKRNMTFPASSGGMNLQTMKDQVNTSQDDSSIADASLTEDPQIAKYKELVGDLLAQETTSKAAAAVVKGVLPNSAAKGALTTGAPNRNEYNWTQSREQRREKYDWMQHKTRDQADNILAFVAEDILASKQRKEELRNEDERVPPPLKKAGEEGQNSKSSLTDLVIVVDKDWDLDDSEPDYDWGKKEDPILTTDSVLHFTGSTPSGSLADLLGPNQARQAMMTDGQLPSFSSRSALSVDVPAKKPMRRFTQLAQGVETKVSAEPNPHASYNWIQHSQSLPSMGLTEDSPLTPRGGASLLKTGTDSGSDPDSDTENDRLLTPARTESSNSLGAFLAAEKSAAQKSTDEIEKIFEWTAALGGLGKSAVPDSQAENDASSDAPPNNASSDSADVAAKQQLRAMTMDHTAPASPGEKQKEKDASILPKMKGGVSREHSSGDKRNHSLRDFIGSSSTLVNQPSLADQTGALTIGTGEAVLVAGNAVAGDAASKQSKGTATHKDKGKERRHQGVERTRSKSLTDVGRARGRTKDEKPRTSKRRASVAKTSNKDSMIKSLQTSKKTTMDSSLKHFIKKDKASQPPDKAARSRQSRESRASTNKSRGSASGTKPKPPSSRGKDHDKVVHHRPSLSRSLSEDVEKMKEKSVAKKKLPARRATVVAGVPNKDVGKLKSKTSHDKSRQKTMHGSKRLSSTHHDHRTKHGRKGEGTTHQSHSGGDRRAQVQRRRSSSLPKMDSMDKAQHGKRGSARTKSKDVGRRGGRRAAVAKGKGPQHRPPERHAPERQRSQSLTDMERTRDGKRPEKPKENVSPPEKGPRKRPTMLSSYDWKKHSASTKSMMSNSSRPERDRRSTLVRTRSQSLSRLFGDKSRGKSDASVGSGRTSMGSGRTPPASSGTYNWSEHKDSSSGTSPTQTKSLRRRTSSRSQSSSSPGQANGIAIENGGVKAGSHNDGDGTTDVVDRRGQLGRTKSRSLTDLVSLVTTTIEESEFESSSKSKLSMGASGKSLQSSDANLQSPKQTKATKASSTQADG